MKKEEIKVLNKGFVALDDFCADDLSVVNSARVSFNKRVEEVSYGDEKLIGFLLKNKHGCYDSETEVLTSEGWRKWPDIVGFELFATLSPKGVIEYQQAERVVHKEVEGPMIKLSMNQVDLLVTPDHNMLAKKSFNTTKPYEYKLIPAKDLLLHSYRIPLTGGDWSGSEQNEARMALLGFFIGGGSFKEISIEFHLKEEREIKFLFEQSEKAGFSVNSNKDDTYLLKSDAEFREICRLCYNKGGEKVIPRSILNSSPKSLESVLSGLMHSDGTCSKTGKETYSTASFILAGEIQELCLKIGRAALIYPHLFTKEDGHYGSKDCYRITIYRKSNSEPRIGWTIADRRNQVKIVLYKGFVHCVTVPNGNLYVRRNGKPCWCGNTPFESNFFRFRVKAPIFVFREWHRHRIGSCLSGDSIITTESIDVRSGRMKRLRRLKDLHDNYNCGVTDVKNRTRFLPSCRNLKLRNLDEGANSFTVQKIEDVYCTGEKEVFSVCVGENALKASCDHKILTADGWAKVNELSGNELIAVSSNIHCSNPDRISSHLRTGIGLWTQQQRDILIKEEDYCYNCGGCFNRKHLDLDHLIPVVTDLSKALDRNNLKPICKECHRIKTSSEQISANRKGSSVELKYVSLAKKVIRVGEEMTYDISMPAPNHNFVANGIVVHNSINEWSARYSRLEPDFYIPEPENVRVQVGKPGNYTYLQATKESAFSFIERLKNKCSRDYEDYEWALNCGQEFSLSDFFGEKVEGIAKEQARFFLNVNIYSEMYWSCNARSLMNFLSLRNSPKSQWELREYAIVLEDIWKEIMPMTYNYFIENGRVAP